MCPKKHQPPKSWQIKTKQLIVLKIKNKTQKIYDQNLKRELKMTNVVIIIKSIHSREDKNQNSPNSIISKQNNITNKNNFFFFIILKKIKTSKL